jgi:type IV pilus assembly protein PilF
MRTALVLAMLALELGGCVAPMAPIETGKLERPMSDLPAATDARRKAKVHVELGQAYFQVGKYGVALDEARAASQYDSGYAPAFQLMGMVHMFLQENEIAASHFEHAIRLSPGDPEIMNSYGWFLCSSGKENAGLELLGRAARNPYYQTPTRAYVNAGLCQLRLKNDAAAEFQFQKALEADGGNLRALFHLADISYRRGAYEATRRYLAALHQGGEPTAESLWLAIRVERRLGNRAAETGYVQQLRRRFPESPEYQAFLQGQYQ